jgi:ABC-type uncharacterized transport system auxiliary subunit
VRALVISAALVACGGKVPETRYYQLAEPTTPPRLGLITLVLENLATDPAYDDERIVYRITPYRLDYYNYHRWSAPPGVMIGNFLEQSLERTGAFRSVVRELAPGAPTVLGGRVVAIEEVDTSPTRWHGRIVLELTLTDAVTGRLLWTEQFEDSEPLAKQTPEGLAHALSIAMTRIADRAAPAIAAHARRAHAEVRR